MSYIFLRGEIDGWGTMDNRDEHKRIIEGVLEKFNSEMKKILIAPFRFEDGTIEGSLEQGRDIYEMLIVFEFKIRPLKALWGVGVCGERVSAIAEIVAKERASEMLSDVVAGIHKSKRAKPEIMIKSDYNDFDSVINTLICLASDIKNRWTKRQNEIVITYFKNGENQNKAAEKVGISQSSIQRSLTSAKYYLFKDAAEGIRKSLEYIMD